MNRQLTEQEKELLQKSAKNMIDIVDDENCINASTSSFEYLSKVTKKKYQVQVIVTCDIDDFIGY